MITLDVCCDIYHNKLLYELDDEQLKYTALPKTWFDDCHQVLKVVILKDNQAVGFFVLDGGDDKYRYTDNDKAVLLRSMSINPHHQGQGIGKFALQKSLLFAFCQTHFLNSNAIILGVNHQNIPAQRLYEKADFIKLSKTYLGISGTQFIYEMT